MGHKHEIDFKYTTQIERYINEILSYWNECRKNMPIQHIRFAEPLLIKTYLKHEIDKGNNETPRYKFLCWLEKEGAIEINDDDKSSGHQITDDEYVAYPEYTEVHVHNIEPVITLSNILSSKVTGASEADNGRVLHFDEGSGKFLYKKGQRRVALRTDETKPYYKFLVAIYLSANEDGVTSVSKIRSVLRKRFKFTASVERKDVQDHINNSIKRILTGNVPAGLKLFEWKRGTDTVYFSNPKLTER